MDDLCKQIQMAGNLNGGWFCKQIKMAGNLMFREMKVMVEGWRDIADMF